jgi:O-antigen/teichoic acid export membrane protein
METNKSKRSLMNNTVALFLGNSMGAVLSFVLIVILGRALGASGLGTYSTALAWVYPITLLAEFGLNTLMLRDLTQDLTQTPRYVRRLFQLRVVIAVPCMLLLVGIASQFSDNPALQTCLLISAPLVLILPLFGMYSIVFRAYEQMALVGLLNFGMLLTQVIFAYLAWMNNQDVTQFALLNTLTSLAQLVVAIAIYQNQFAPLNRISEHTDTSEAFNRMGFVRRAFPFAIGGILAVVQTRLAIILIERLVSPTEAGYFVVALRFLDMVRLLPMAHYDAIFPRLSSLQSQPKLTDAIVWRSGAWLLLYGIVATAITLIIAPQIVTWVFGSEYQETVRLLAILGMAITPMILRGLLNTWAYATGKEIIANGVALAYIVVLGATFLVFWGETFVVTQRLAVAVIVTESLIFMLLLIIFLLKPRPR